MWRKLPGGIKLDPMQPKLSTNNRGFQTGSKSGHQFLRRFSEHRAATHFLIKNNTSIGWHEIDAVHVERGRRRPLGIRLNDVAVNALRVARVSEIDLMAPRITAISAFIGSFLFSLSCRPYYLPASTCQR